MPRTDRPRRPFRPRCLALGMIAAWIVAQFVPSLIIAATGAVGTPGDLAATWTIADQMGFRAKATQALLLTALLLGSRRLAMSERPRIALDALLGAAAMLLLLAILPESWSTGIGIGLTGQRFDPATLPAYLAGGLLAGLAFNLADRKCGELKAQG